MWDRASGPARPFLWKRAINDQLIDLRRGVDFASLSASRQSSRLRQVSASISSARLERIVDAFIVPRYTRGVQGSLSLSLSLSLPSAALAGHARV